MAVAVVIFDEAGVKLDSFIAQPRTPDEQPLDTAHAIRDLVGTVTQVEDASAIGE